MADPSDVDMQTNGVDDNLPETTNGGGTGSFIKDAVVDEGDWIRLQSEDGFSYLVKRKVAQVSGTIRNMLDPTGGYAEANSRICEIKEKGIIVEKLIEYMCFKAHYENVGPKEEIPVKEFLERIPPEIVLELLLAADYQDL